MAEVSMDNDEHFASASLPCMANATGALTKLGHTLCELEGCELVPGPEVQVVRDPEGNLPGVTGHVIEVEVNGETRVFVFQVEGSALTFAEQAPDLITDLLPDAEIGNLTVSSI